MNGTWAIARNTILQALRMRMIAFGALFVIILFPAILITLKSSGTQKAQVQILITYSLELANLFLSVLTLFLGCWTLCVEIQDRQIFSLDTKPVPRWQILAGKWLGVILVNATILLLMAAATYGIILAMAKRASPRDRRELAEELLIGRRSVQPVRPDLLAEARAEFTRKLREGASPEGQSREDAQREAWSTVYRRHENVPAQTTRTWQFVHIPRPEAIPREQCWFLRFKLYSAGVETRKEIRGRWRIRRPDSAALLETDAKVAIGQFREFRLPLAILPQDGILLVEFTNLDPGGDTAVVPLADGIEILYPSLPFAVTFANACALLLLRIGFLAAVAIGLSTFLTFPMAMTMSSIVWFFCMVADYMLDVAHQTYLLKAYGFRVEEATTWADEILRQYLKVLFALVPNFTAYSPVPLLTDGREVGFPLLGSCLLYLLLVRGGLIAIISCWIFNKRELAKLVR